MANTAKNKVIGAIRQSIIEGKYPIASRLPTELEIASVMGVARGTVRGAFKDLCAEGILEEKRGIGRFVTQKAAELRAENRKFAVILPSLDGRDAGPGIFLGGIERAAAAADWEVSIFSLAHDPTKIDGIFEKLRARGISRVLFIPLSEENAMESNNIIIDRFEAENLRYVVLDIAVQRSGIIRGDFVGTDGYRAMREVVQHLIGEGVRRFGFLGVFPGIYSGEQRRCGVIDELRRHNISMRESDLLTIDDVPLAEQGRNQIRNWLNSPDGLPEVILCVHDQLAINVLDELAPHDIRVPNQVLVTGFDDLATDESIGLSSVRQPFDRVGTRAVELLLDDHRDSVIQELLPCEFIARRSSRIPRGTYHQKRDVHSSHKKEQLS
ncbi:MAG: LacI family DNA-binding transcriptional regulator [Victivallaceae bacterium]|nr:LacI family DNA-binding transcriptional regulator [Victivallaceae bacterium]